MARRPDLFDPIEAALVRAGEVSGTLGQACRSLATRFDREAEFRRSLLAPLAYPAFLVHLAIVAFPVPSIVAEGFGAYARTVAGGFLALYGGGLLLVVLHFVFEEDRGYGKFLRSLPMLGRAIRDLAYARFARALAALHGAGVAFDRALAVAGETLGVAAWTEEARGAARGVREGETLGIALVRLPAIPFEVMAAAEVGEASGSLEETLARAAGDLEERGRAALARLAKIVPVVVFLFVAIWIGARIVTTWLRYYASLG